MSGAEAALRAARLGDEITHGMGMVGMVAGALIGAAIGAAIVVAGVATGGLAIAVIVGGCIAGGGLAGGALARGIMRAANLSGPTAGTLGQGSKNVTVNGRPAMRAGVDFTPRCSGAPLNHFPKPNVLIAQGAKRVTVNGKPMARTDMRMACGAKIKTGSSNVFVGSETVTVVEIQDNEELFEMALTVLGTAALLGAGLGAIAAGALPALAFGGVVLASHFGMAELYKWGESLGPGYGDIMVGAAGFALMGVGVRAARTPTGRTAFDGLNRSTEATTEHTISLYGFRGAGSVADLAGRNAPHPYVVTGHVGYSFNGGKTIYGFGPNVPKNMSSYDAVQSLRNKVTYPGKITDDTALFKAVSARPAIGRDGKPQVVVEQKIPVSKAEFGRIKAEHDAIGVNRPMDDVRYGFPDEGACTFNCATFPSKLGIPIPETSGNLRNYIPQLEKNGNVWQP
nr:PAAR domain-containing protein [uncultured Caldimonas sp.]